MDIAKDLSPDVLRRLIEAGYDGDKLNYDEIFSRTHGKLDPKSIKGYNVRSILSGKYYHGSTPGDAFAELWIAEPESRAT